MVFYDAQCSECHFYGRLAIPKDMVNNLYCPVCGEALEDATEGKIDILDGEMNY